MRGRCETHMAYSTVPLRPRGWNIANPLHILPNYTPSHTMTENSKLCTTIFDLTMPKEGWVFCVVADYIYTGIYIYIWVVHSHRDQNPTPVSSNLQIPIQPTTMKATQILAIVSLFATSAMAVCTSVGRCGTCVRNAKQNSSFLSPC
jgi:hypothetical protein